MAFSFDLISDLHVETWPDTFTWDGMPTSPLCVVAGDIAKDRDCVIDVLGKLAQVYQTVVYIDGNEEHKYYMTELEDSRLHLASVLKKHKNIINLKEQVAVIDGVAFVGCNGWWTYDFDEPEHYDATKQWYVDSYKVSMDVACDVETHAMVDTTYLSTTIQKLQTHQDVREIVIVTHTVPFPELVEHDIDLQGSHRLNCTGNSHLARALVYDTEAKISTWCFGHYHGGDIDTILKGVRFINNPRGRGTTRWCKHVYYPKKVFL